MGLFGKIKKGINRTVRKVENFAHRAAGKDQIGETSSRSDAADQLLKKKDIPVVKQAGSGQISYTGETYE